MSLSAPFLSASSENLFPSMAASSSSSPLFLFPPLFLLLGSLTHAQTSFQPDALVLPVLKDARTLQYVAHINQRTPLVPVKLVIDLSGRFLWVDCDSGYVSSSYRPSRCRSSQCSLANANSCGDCFSGPRPGCNNNVCSLSLQNTFIRTSTSGELAEDLVSIQSTDGSSPGPIVTVPRFLISCAPTFLLQGLATGVEGIAGLGRTRIALPSQFAAAFNFDRKFAICLSSSTASNGVIFFGDGPYMFLPNVDVSKFLMYTPLLTRSSVQGEPSDEYFVGVKTIKINGKQVLMNTSLLSFDSDGVRGTKISTVYPCTTLETSIYKAFTEDFIREAKSMNIAPVAPVAPFDVCFRSKSIATTRVGPVVPTVDLVLQSESVYWRILGANSMVSVNDDVACLAFVDGGSNPRTSIVIGGHQLEGNLLQFDLASSRLGFSSSLLFRQTTCAHFNFTSNG